LARTVIEPRTSRSSITAPARVTVTEPDAFKAPDAPVVVVLGRREALVVVLDEPAAVTSTAVLAVVELDAEVDEEGAAVVVVGAVGEVVLVFVFAVALVTMNGTVTMLLVPFASLTRAVKVCLPAATSVKRKGLA
jgi:hypothetical protein